MRPFLVLPVLFLLTSCGALAALQSKSGIDELRQELRAADAAEKRAREQADSNKDGKLTGSELLTYGGLLAAAAGAEMGRRKAKALDGKHKESAEHRDELDSKVADLIRREDIRLALQREKDKA
jgi:hypothetical protein